MEHTFRLAGNLYVAKNGDDASSTDPTANPQCVDPTNTATFKPLRTLVKALSSLETNQTLIIGAGTYTESIRVIIGYRNVAIRGEGEVVIAGTPSSEFFMSFAVAFYDITFTNIQEDVIVSHTAVFLNCKLVNCHFGVGTSPSIFYMFRSGSQLIDCNITNTDENSRCDITNSIVIGSHLKNVYSVKSSYVNYGSKILLYSQWNGGIKGEDFQRNNIEGEIATALLGTDPTDAQYMHLAEHQNNFGDFNVNSISAPPKFNRPNVGDFSLQPDSPHLGLGDGEYSNIGGTEVALSAFVGASDSHLADIGPWREGRVDLLTNNYVVRAGETDGYLELAAIKIADYPAPVQKLNYFGKLAFDSYAADGSADKRNVPDSVLGSTSTKAATPDRLSVQMRWTTGSIEPLSHLNFDNQGTVPAGEWVDMEINQKPMIDGAGKGNGHPDFSPASAQGIAATWIQIKIVLRNDYTTVV